MGISRSKSDRSENSISIVDSSSQITKELRQASSQLINKAQTSDNPSQSEKYIELALILANKASDIQKSASEKSALEKSEDKKLLEKILSTTDLSVREQLLDFYPILITKQEQVRQNGFIRKMVIVFYSTGLFIGTAGAFIEAPIFIGSGLFLLGASAFSIVPDYVSKVADKLNIPGVFSKIPSNGDDKPNTGDKDQDSQTEK